MKSIPIERPQWLPQRTEIQAPDNQRINRQYLNEPEIAYEFTPPKSVKNKSGCLPKLACTSKYMGSISIGLGLALLAVTLAMGATLGTLAIPLLLLASSLILFSFFSFFFSYKANCTDNVEISDKANSIDINNAEQIEQQIKIINTEIKVDKNLSGMDIPEKFSTDLLDRQLIREMPTLEQRQLMPSNQQFPQEINENNLEKYRYLFNPDFRISFRNIDTLEMNSYPIQKNVALLASLKENGYRLISKDFIKNRAVFIDPRENKGLKISTKYFSSVENYFHSLEHTYSDERLNDIYSSPHFYGGQYSYLSRNKLINLTLGEKSFIAHEFVYEPKLEPLEKDEMIPYSVLQMIEKAGFIYNDNKSDNFLKIKTEDGFDYIPIDSKLVAETKNRFLNTSFRTREIRCGIKYHIDQKKLSREDPEIYYRYPKRINFN